MMPSITIKVRTILTLKRILGKGEFEFTIPEGNTLRELLAELVRQGAENALIGVPMENATSLLDEIVEDPLLSVTIEAGCSHGSNP